MIDWVHASLTVIESVTYFFRRKLSLGLFVTIHFNGIPSSDTEFIHFHPIICTAFPRRSCFALEEALYLGASTQLNPVCHSTDLAFDALVPFFSLGRCFWGITRKSAQSEGWIAPLSPGAIDFLLLSINEPMRKLSNTSQTCPVSDWLPN